MTPKRKAKTVNCPYMTGEPLLDDIDGDGIRPPDEEWELFDSVVEGLEFDA